MKKNLKDKKGFYIGIGLIVGTIVGVLTNNFGIWFVLGLVFGVVLEKNYNKSERE